MPSVVLSRELARQYTGGETRLEVEEGAQTVRAVIRSLDARYPGLGTVLRTQMAVAIDGQIYQHCLEEPVAEASELCFMPAIEGG